MFNFVTGNLFDSKAQALVNAVNCEGFMGKGIAYQFKTKFPENNSHYINECKQGKLKVGKLCYFIEKGRIIVNFPTKNKWRENSKIEYIEDGLVELIGLIEKLKIQSIAIPPLGSGNGGLLWPDVKEVIQKKLSDISSKIEIFVYEPSIYHNVSISIKTEPKLNASALILMEIKEYLKKFSNLRLQSTAYFVNIFSQIKYFDFNTYKFNPYDQSIDIVSNNIREFQKFHNLKSTKEAKKILYNKIVSESVDGKLSKLNPAIQKACDFVNIIESDHELECLTRVCYTVEERTGITKDEVVWLAGKGKKFSDSEILSAIDILVHKGIVDETFVGYKVVA